MEESRKKILRINPVFTQCVLEMQGGIEDYYSEGDEETLEHDEDPVILTKEQADKLNQEAIDYYEKISDKNPFEDITNLNSIGGAWLKSGKKEAFDYLFDIGSFIEELRKKLNQDDLLVLGCINNSPWLEKHGNTKYTPEKNALNYLKGKVKKYFSGGFKLKENEIIEFIPHLFWLVRCRSVSEVIMGFNNAKCIFSFCQYGILHFSFYDSNEEKEILDYCLTRDFSRVIQCHGHVEFDNFEGRKLNI